MIVCERSTAVWSEATEQGRRISREPDHAASGLLQAGPSLRSGFRQQAQTPAERLKFGAKRQKLKSDTAFTLSFPPSESMRMSLAGAVE